MLDMSTWDEKTLDVISDLKLDPKNIRLESATNAVEADIMADLFANEQAFSLVEGIATAGYLTHEIPIVVLRDGKYIVVEGNRRLAALKAIQNPLLVTEFTSQIKAVSKGVNKASLKKIQVKVAPNQEQADELIATLHTSNARRAWGPVRQAAFFQAQIDAGRTYKWLVSHYPLIKVRKFVFRSRILTLFKKVKYADPAHRDYFNTAKGKKGLSTLARVYESQDFLDMTGISMNANGVLTRKVSNATFKQLATVIVAGMVDESLNTRSLNSVTSPRFGQLMKELATICKVDPKSPIYETPQPPPSGGGPTAGGPANPPPGGGPKTKTTTPSGKTNPPPKPAKVHYLDLSQLKVPTSYPTGLRLQVEELSHIDIQAMPNTAFLAFRAVLEKSIKALAEEKSETIANKKHPGAFVQLKDCLDWLLDYAKQHGPKAIQQPIISVTSGSIVNFDTTTSAMNANNHNHHFVVDPDKALNMWHSIESIVRYALKP
jgi:hypothetical protein